MLTSETEPVILKRSDPAIRATQDKIRVVIVSEPGTAGVKRHLVDLLRHLDTTPFHVTFIYSLERSDRDYPREIAELETRGIECRKIPIVPTLQFGADLRALVNLWNVLRRIKPHVVHLHSSKAGGLGRLACLLIFPHPFVIYTPHAMACFRSRFYLWLERMLGVFTSRLVSVSKSEKQDFIRWKIPGAANTQVLTVGVTLPGVERRSERDEADAQPWRIGACGRICYQKNALLFFQVALAMLKLSPNYQFCWIGDFGDDKESDAVRTLLDEAGWPKQIQVTGWVSNPEKWIKSLDSFCIFSRYESFGYVTAEAQLLRVPVVGTRSTGTVDLIVDGETGLLADRTVESLIAALTRLQVDKELRHRVCEGGAKLVGETLTVENMAREMKEIYLMGASPARRR